MSFFGLTTLGHNEPIKDAIAPTHAYTFHEISEEQYMETFSKYLLGASSSIATTLEIDGETHVLRASLGDMLRELLGRTPRKLELDAWFTCLDFDRSAVLGVDEFKASLQALIEFSGNPQAPVQYGSFVQFKEHWTRHVRVEYNFQRTTRGPMTTQQEIGWHSLKPAPKTENHSLNNTDVTKGEGRNAASYYGHLICGNYDQRSKQ